MSIRCRTFGREERINYSQQTETTIRKIDVIAFLFWLSSPLYLSFPSLMVFFSSAFSLAQPTLLLWSTCQMLSDISLWEWEREREKEREMEMERKGWIDRGRFGKRERALRESGMMGLQREEEKTEVGKNEIDWGKLLIKKEIVRDEEKEYSLSKRPKTFFYRMDISNVVTTGPSLISPHTDLMPFS